MKITHNLSQLKWTLSGYRPYEWLVSQGMKLVPLKPEIDKIPASVPGSVQKALLNAKIIPDWNIGFNSRNCEWIENRHWVFEAEIPQEWLSSWKQAVLKIDGLDYSGWIYLNWKELARFDNSHIRHVVELAESLESSANRIQVVFDLPPRWLGTPAYTHLINEWKPRFNYGWDWMERIVQTGIWDTAVLEVNDCEAAIKQARIITDADAGSGKGILNVSGEVCAPPGCLVQAALLDKDNVIKESSMSVSDFNNKGLNWEDINIELWWPNGHGKQPLYNMQLMLLDEARKKIDVIQKRIGFKNIQWTKCQGAAANADPWICTVNNKPVFLQGINWTPIRPNFADVSASEYASRMGKYHDIGVNTMRVWGGAFLEKELFYDLCDELGFLVWQEFPMSSSMMSNSPPCDDKSICEMAKIAESFIERRQHHVSLFAWCGGNELQTAFDGSHGIGKPLGTEHPMLGRLADIVKRFDPGRRFLATSGSGPRFGAEEKYFGKGEHWDVHGPWKAHDDIKDWAKYWNGDDALFRSEVGAPGPSSAELIRRYKGECDEMPANWDNPLWRKVQWWPEWDLFVKVNGREPGNLEEYVKWGQERQAIVLKIAASACKKRFPRCGGFILWMGHDSYPCATNTSIIDFEGNLKPAAKAIAEVFNTEAGKLEI